MTEEKVVIEGEWARVQRMRKEEHPLMQGGRCRPPDDSYSFAREVQLEYDRAKQRAYNKKRLAKEKVERRKTLRLKDDQS